MTLNEKDSTPDSEQRASRVEQVLRKTHLDEIPQPRTILPGKMGVVDPRATWADGELLLEAEPTAWRKRWVIKPGLTGLAQINDASSAEARENLHYDLLYIRQQSLWFDLEIVAGRL